MKFFRILGIIALALLVTASVYAETQSVKVSGDLSITGIGRSNYELRTSSPESDIVLNGSRNGMTADTGVPEQRNDNSWFMSTTEVQIDADLTDNVQTVIRLLNERDWNVRAKTYNVGSAINGPGGNTPQGFQAGAYGTNGNEFDVELELAYVTLKDFIYSPLTVTIGRQNLWLGKGFIVGANLDNTSSLNLTAPEQSKMHAFDAVKVVLDYDPWTITGIYSKIWENATGDDDDVNLYGVNVGYKFDAYKAEAEGYWFLKQDSQVERWVAKGDNNVNTVGIRGSFDPIDVVTISGEVAYQFGSYVGATQQTTLRSRSAWALDLAAEWRYFMDKCSWKPKLGAEYILYSGNRDDANGNNDGTAYAGWDPMYRGKFDSHIREWVGRYYATYDYRTTADFYAPTADASFTNQNQLIFSASIQPLESLTIRGNYNLFWTYEDYVIRTSNSSPGSSANKYGGLIGQEIDLSADWAYTEDVTFSVLGAFFMPGAHVYYGNNDATATDLVGSVTVNF
jgi:hypothetical protein